MKNGDPPDGQGKPPWLVLFALAAVIAGLLLAAARARLPEFWGDGATYYSMAWSLARDGDLRYEMKDLLRVKQEFPSGPQGVFLKRASGGLTWDPSAGFPWVRRVAKDAPRVYFAKPFVHALAAAPLVWLFGTRGLLLTNAVFLSLALVLGYVLLRGRGEGIGATLSVIFFFGTVAPVYLFWPTPEVFNLGVVTAGLVAWSRGRPMLSALLLGLATYSKPYNLWLAIPLGLAPLLGWTEAEGGRQLPERFWGRFLEALRRGVVLGGTTLALFGVNAALTGEMNYQGGERKTFYGLFPGERRSDGREVTFGNSGIWMTVQKLGPKVEGEEGLSGEKGAEPPRSAPELRTAFLYNLVYYWIGRFGGALAYFPVAFLAVIAFLALGPRDRAGWLALAALLVSVVFYVAMIPDNWYGGSGTVGNRYFLNLLPLTLYLVPRGREAFLAIGGLLGTMVFTGWLLLNPIQASVHSGYYAMRTPFRLLLPELTMLNDLSIFAERWRWKRPYGDTEGDPQKRWPADPRAYYLYFPDDGTYGREEAMGEQGFWLRGGAQAEIFLRALEPVRLMVFQVTGGPLGDRVRLRVGGREERLDVSPLSRREVTVEPGRAFVYKDSFVYVLHLSSTRGGIARDALGTDRNLGAFIRIALQVDKRVRPASPGT